MTKYFSIYLVSISLFTCQYDTSTIVPEVITEETRYDSDDPAIWVNHQNPSESIIFGTDKNPDGAIYAFDLDGNILEEKILRNLQKPINVDVAYGLKLNDSTEVDILVFTEREGEQIRLYSVPEMVPLDQGGFKVFKDEEDPEFRKPSGISLYTSPDDNSIYAIVGRKSGPAEGYLYQYEIFAEESVVELKRVRKFGNFSGKKEIEAIAVDDELGYVYYSDETFGVRKYYADPKKGNDEILCFGEKTFAKDHEGIAIVAYEDGQGYVIVSNQQNNTFRIYSRMENNFMAEIDLGSVETDGCEVVTVPLNDRFDSGLFVTMNDDRTFHYHKLSTLDSLIASPVN